MRTSNSLIRKAEYSIQYRDSLFIAEHKEHGAKTP